MHRRALLATILLVCGTSACAGAPAARTAPPIAAVAETHVRDELYFGMRKADGGIVGEAEWQAFVDAVVTPRFREGLTVLTGYGQYLASNGELVREPSKVLILVHEGGPDAERGIREIAAEYCRRFEQEAVMRVTDRVRARVLGRGVEADAAPAPPRPTATVPRR